MENILKKMAFNYYIVFVLLIVVGICGYFLSRVLTIDSMTPLGVALQTLVIILLLLCIPLGIKIHSKKVQKLQENENEEEKLLVYSYWSAFRLTMIAIPLLLAVLLFYLMQSNSMLFCGGIAALALLYCKPIPEKIFKELNIE
jgi:protein-S-isoprenylcysteine O-methyltransferase Ste14